jgi:hypothetical protein
MDSKNIGLYILYFGFILFGPILLMFPLWTKILNIENGKTKILTLHIGKTKIITNQKSVASALLTIAVLFCLDYILPIPFFTFIVIFIISAFLSEKLQIIDRGELIVSDSIQIKNELKATLDKIKLSVSSIENLSLELEAKSTELNEKSAYSNSLDGDIKKKLNEYESWKNLSEDEKQLFVSAVDKTVNKKGTFTFLKVVIGSVILNLVASFVWSILGNPDKQTLLQFLKQLLGIE